MAKYCAYKFSLISMLHVLQFCNICIFINQTTSRIFKLTVLLICRVLLLLFIASKLTKLLRTKLLTQVYTLLVMVTHTTIRPNDIHEKFPSYTTATTPSTLHSSVQLLLMSLLTGQSISGQCFSDSMHQLCCT